MRFLLEAAAVLAVIGVPIALASLVWRSGQSRTLTGRRRRAALRRSRWHAASTLLGNKTVVSISRSIPAGASRESIGEMVIAEISADDPDWDIKLSQAMVDARVRAEILNQETPQG